MLQGQATVHTFTRCTSKGWASAGRWWVGEQQGQATVHTSTRCSGEGWSAGREVGAAGPGGGAHTLRTAHAPPPTASQPNALTSKPSAPPEPAPTGQNSVSQLAAGETGMSAKPHGPGYQPIAHAGKITASNFVLGSGGVTVLPRERRQQPVPTAQPQGPGGVFPPLTGQGSGFPPPQAQGNGLPPLQGQGNGFTHLQGQGSGFTHLQGGGVYRPGAQLSMGGPTAGFAGGVSSGMSQGMSGGMAGGMAVGMAGGSGSGMAGRMAGGMAGGMAGAMAGGMAGGPGALPGPPADVYRVLQVGQQQHRHNMDRSVPDRF